MTIAVSSRLPSFFRDYMCGRTSGECIEDAAACRRFISLTKTIDCKKLKISTIRPSLTKRLSGDYEEPLTPEEERDADDDIERAVHEMQTAKGLPHFRYNRGTKRTGKTPSWLKGVPAYGPEEAE